MKKSNIKVIEKQLEDLEKTISSKNERFYADKDLEKLQLIQNQILLMILKKIDSVIRTD